MPGEIAYKIDQEYSRVSSDPTLEKNEIIMRDMNNLFAKYDNCAGMFEKTFNSIENIFVSHIIGFEKYISIALMKSE